MAKHHLALATLAASLFLPASAGALEPSSRDKPFYVEGAFPLGFNVFGGYGFGGCGRFGGGCGWSTWRPDIEVGFHFTGRHDGFVLGIRHVFYIGGDYLGNGFGMAGLIRLGYDIPIPIKGGKYEITIAPYGLLGAAFYGGGPSGGLQTGGGCEGKFFLLKGFYVFARPLDFGVQCLHDIGRCSFQWQFGAGAGYAW